MPAHHQGLVRKKGMMDAERDAASTTGGYIMFILQMSKLRLRE